MITVVLGGARSGKSKLAEDLIADHANRRNHSLDPELKKQDVLYVATARPWADDSHFAARISLHRSRRPSNWITEDQTDLLDVLAHSSASCILVDDLGTWITELFNSAEAWPGMSRAEVGGLDDVRRGVDKLVQLLAKVPETRDVVLVTPEVGMSVIPESAAGRVFRDELGALNARVAEVADEVLLVVAGCRLTLKSENRDPKE